jgi:PKD repeat protein
MGRVMTHEMGHVFDLYHTFNGGSCSETNCNTQGDLCCDTPPHPGANANCSTPECGGTQPVNNYMDYTGEVCQNMFTQCQKDRMRAVCAGPRAGLFAAPCGCPPLLALDAGVISISSPSGTSCGDSLCPQVEIKNFGSDTLVSVTINYQIDVTNYTYSWTGSLAPNFTEVVQLPCVIVPAGSHTFTSWTTLPNGGTDMDLLNDTSSTTFTTILGSAVDLTLVTDNFGYETYWDITDCNSTIYGSGGYSGIPPGGTQSAQSSSPSALASSTTYNEAICLPDGCYCFNIYDDFGDGICCGNGIGSYLLVDQFGNTLASGGSFTTSETGINFCVTSTPPLPGFTSTNSTICEGDTITFTDTSTSNPISWSWTFPGGTPATSTDQNPVITYNTTGVYDVTLAITNAVTTNTQTFTNYVTVNANPTVSITATEVNCSCNGTANATPLTGAAPYTYSWNDPGSQNTSNATGLCAGTYVLTLSDANGCTMTELVSIIETSNYSTAIATTDVSCNGAGDGAATVTASGGQIPYTYVWSNSNTTSSVSSLSPNTYSVTVTDANGCTSIESVTIAEPGVLGVSTSGVDATCYGSCNGSGTATVTGGVSPFTYLWDDSRQQTTASALLLCAGSYNVIVTDANGCTATAGISLNQLPQIVLVMDSTDASCGAADGTATVTASGGGGTPYSYFWNVIPLQTSNIATGLSAGIYSVMVTDANGCSEIGDVSINATGGPVATISSSTDLICNGICDGAGTLSVSGGTSPLTYLWSDAANQTTQTATGLCALNYNIKVTDANGCVSTASIDLTEPPMLGISITDSTNVSCNSLCDGAATVTAVGGTGAYTYLWSNGQTTSTATALCAANYSVTVTDANSCNASISVTITQPPPLLAPTYGAVTPCPCPCAGVARVFPDGGTPPYTVVWTNGATEEYLSKLCDGTYGVTVTDANGCIVVGTNIVIIN